MLFIAREHPCRIPSILSFCLTDTKRLPSYAANPSRHHVGAPRMTADVSRPSSLPRSEENTPRFSGTRGNNPNAPCHTNESHSCPTDGLGSDNESDSNASPRIHASRNSRSHKDPIPSQLGFYKGYWVHILNSAKALFRYVIHTDVPFPERSNKYLKIAQECILKAINKYMTENEDAEIDSCRLPLPLCSTLANIITVVYEANKVGMTTLISPDDILI